MKLQPVNVATREQTTAIRAIEPALNTEHEVIRPASVTMKDGTVYPRVFCRLNARYSDKGDWINPEDIVEVRESPYRLPQPLAKKLYDAGESGMGYVCYILVFHDGRSLVCTSGGLVDFPDLPEGYRYEDAVEVLPHEGRERTAREGYRKDAEAVFLDYVPFDWPGLTE